MSSDWAILSRKESRVSQAYRILIGGKWRDGKQLLQVTNKYTGEALGSVPITDRDLFEEAVVAAQSGLSAMAQVPAYQRARILESTSESIERDKEEISQIIAAEAGKAIRHARAEVERAVETFKLASEQAKSIHGETVPMDACPGGEKRVGFYLRFPVGIVGAISPFNFPLNLVAHKVAPAIAAGCSVILKPASTTPLTALTLGRIMMEAGLPDGALNITIGPGSTVGNWLVTDERISMITFTGSPPVGRDIKAKSGLKKVTLELGSNSACIIDESADLGAAVPRCITGSFAYAGQICISVQRIYVHRRLWDQFTEEFVQGTKRLKLGDPLDPETDIGPMITEQDAKRTESWINEAVEGGAKILTGGKREKNFYHPTVLAVVKPEMKVMALEIFAPVVSLVPFDDFSDAVRMADDSVYGLQAGVFTSNIEHAFEAIKSIKVGGVIVNDVPTYRADQMPYGGVKESGIGREGLKFAIEEMTDLKMVVFNLQK
jgi:acyl-CoA reductase-like NAD-dependent aldehyde dehydrogenase